MAEFTMKIAGHTAKVTSGFESTPQYFKSYLCEDPPEFSIAVTRETIDFEQADLLEEAPRDGFRPRVFTDPFLERAAIQRAFAEFLFDRNVLMIHGSTVAVDGKVITGCGMGAAMQFGGALIRMMKGAEKEEAILSAILADRE